MKKGWLIVKKIKHYNLCKKLTSMGNTKENHLYSYKNIPRQNKDNLWKLLLKRTVSSETSQKDFGKYYTDCGPQSFIR